MNTDGERGAGLYVHIPFCASKCHYCDFYSIGCGASGELPLERVHQYLRALDAELSLRGGEIDGARFDTIYIGGGTPSLLPSGDLGRLVERLREFALESGATELREVTVEANPEHVTREWLEAMKAAGVTRVSIGVQSFSDGFLEAIGRSHKASEAIRALSLLDGIGMNHSADLIYGLPGQSLRQWADDLERMMEFHPPHFSAYLLSYEPRTRLYARMQRGLIEPADEELACAMYNRLCLTAQRCGYHHYEISNFGLPGREALHNSRYWDLTPYLGLGCSAHSFDGVVRRYNPSDIRRYTEALLRRGQTCYSIEDETPENSLNDYIITSLRTDSGLSPQLILHRWGQALLLKVEDNLRRQMKRGSIERHADLYVIPRELWLRADAILRDLIL